MRSLLVLLFILNCSIGFTQTQPTSKTGDYLVKTTSRLKKELALSIEQEQQILALRREEWRVLDSIQQVQKKGTVRFNPKNFIRHYDIRMRVLLTAKQLTKLDALTQQRTNAIKKQFQVN